MQTEMNLITDNESVQPGRAHYSLQISVSMQVFSEHYLQQINHSPLYRSVSTPPHTDEAMTTLGLLERV